MKQREEWFVKLASRCSDAPFYAQQKWTEYADLLSMMCSVEPGLIVEIGVYKGGTIKGWTEIALPDATIIGVDLPDGPYGGGFTEEQGEMINGLARYDQNIVLLAMDSKSSVTIERVTKLVRSKSYLGADILFIDGDHTYEGAMADFDNYSGLVREGGYIILHDIVEHGNYKDVKVHEVWEELKETYPNKEFTEFIDLDFPTDHGKWGGIGVIKW